MSDRSSVRRKGFLGGEYTDHYDSSGKRTGRTHHETSALIRRIFFISLLCLPSISVAQNANPFAGIWWDKCNNPSYAWQRLPSTYVVFRFRDGNILEKITTSHIFHSETGQDSEKVLDFYTHMSRGHYSLQGAILYKSSEKTIESYSLLFDLDLENKPRVDLSKVQRLIEEVKSNDFSLPAEEPQSFIKCPKKEDVIKAHPIGKALDFVDKIENACASNTENCTQEIFGIIDITSEGNISKAEIARALRHVILREAVQKMELDSSQQTEPTLLVTSIGSTAVAPYVAQNIIDNFDYDADGQLSLEELLIDYKQ